MQLPDGAAPSDREHDPALFLFVWSIRKLLDRSVFEVASPSDYLTFNDWKIQSGPLPNHSFILPAGSVRVAIWNMITDSPYMVPMMARDRPGGVSVAASEAYANKGRYRPSFRFVRTFSDVLPKIDEPSISVFPEVYDLHSLYHYVVASTSKAHNADHMYRFWESIVDTDECVTYGFDNEEVKKNTPQSARR